jgi:type II secretion system protein I
MPSERCGFTLLEILVTLIIFTVGVMAVFELLSLALATGVDAENTAIAVNLSQQRMEEVRNLDFDTGIVNEAKSGVSGFAGFEREVTVTTAQTDLKQVTVTTYWTSKANEVSVPLETYISRN